MSEPSSSSPTTSSTATTAAASQTTGSAVSPQVAVATSVPTNESQLSQYPKLWHAIQQGIAMQIINNMQTRNNDLIAQMKQAEEDQAEDAS